MAVYSFSIVVRALSEEQAFDVFDLDDCVGGGATSGIPYVGFEVDTDMPETALDRAIEGLRSLGLEPERIDMDLVNASAIAERVGVSRQAVRHWSEGERAEGFPSPFSSSNGQRIWRWSDVFAWLRANAKDVEPEYESEPLPSSVVQCFNGHLADPLGPYASPAAKRAATGGIPIVVDTGDDLLVSLVELRVIGVSEHVDRAVIDWSESFAEKRQSQRLDHRVRKSVTPAGSYRERAS